MYNDLNGSGVCGETDGAHEHVVDAIAVHPLFPYILQALNDVRGGECWRYTLHSSVRL